MKLKKSLLMVVAVLIAGLMITGGCGLFGGGDDQGSPEEVVKAYFEAFKNKEFKTAIALTLDGEEVSDSELEMLESIFEDFQIKKFEIGETKPLSSTEALVPVTITTSFGGDESVSTDEIRVVLQDGKWYIDEGGGQDDDWDDRDAPQMDFDDDFFDDDFFDDIDFEDDEDDTDEEDDDEEEEDEE